ncbi:MAG: Os1348 family NHLP clan protein, partial [Anaerolineales bacterium]|nr:Os1348 family NHLP clan protein [Anaerolineales bacterium]
MSQKAVLEIVNKALVDRGFRKRLFSDPNAALAGYNLTQGEVKAIRLSLEAGEGAGPAGDLDPRISRARLPLDILTGLFASAGLDPAGQDANSTSGHVSDQSAPAPKPGSERLPNTAERDIGEQPESGVYGAMKAMLDQTNEERADRRAGLHGPHGDGGKSGEAAIGGKAREVSEDREAAEDQFGAAIIAGAGSAVASASVASNAGQGPAPEHAAGVPPGAESQNAVGAMPEPIPHPADAGRVGAMPEPIPHPADGAGAIGTMPEPISHPADAGAVGAMPEPIPHPADAGRVGAMPEPIPHPTDPGMVGAMPEPIPHPA